MFKLNEAKCFGPDKIHPKLLKGLSKNVSFVKAVTLLFNTCYSHGKIPEIWQIIQFGEIITSFYPDYTKRLEMKIEGLSKGKRKCGQCELCDYCRKRCAIF